MTEKFVDLGFAKLDISRHNRTGLNETVFCAGKTPSQLLKILQTFQQQNRAVLGTKCSREKYEYVTAAGVAAKYDEVSGLIFLDNGVTPQALAGTAAVCTGGTADIPIAEEAARTIEFLGGKVERYYDVGVALHRLLDKLEDIRRADVIVAAAGMEGALGSVLGGLVEAPVIAVPTSVGYGASFGGLAALLTMLNSCAEGISVVNIDNGYGAGVLACKILKMAGKKL